MLEHRRQRVHVCLTRLALSGSAAYAAMEGGVEVLTRDLFVSCQAAWLRLAI